MVVDDGNHTFLAAELFPVTRPRRFVSPTDFNCMGYAVPAAIGAKLAKPDLQVVAIVGDGAFLMTGLEIVTATTHQAGIAFFVFHDGELSQISQGQEIPYNRKTCTVLGEIRFEGVASATGAAFIPIGDDAGIDGGIREALRLAGTGRRGGEGAARGRGACCCRAAGRRAWRSSRRSPRRKRGQTAGSRSAVGGG